MKFKKFFYFISCFYYGESGDSELFEKYIPGLTGNQIFDGIGFPHAQQEGVLFEGDNILNKNQV